MPDRLRWALAIAFGWALGACSSDSESDDSPLTAPSLADNAPRR